jgi:hypothetical protein
VIVREYHDLHCLHFQTIHNVYANISNPLCEVIAILVDFLALPRSATQGSFTNVFIKLVKVGPTGNPAIKE